MRRASVFATLICAAAVALILAGCPAGDDGDAGPQGPPGPTGEACWDLNGNGQPDPATEDLNGDGVVDTLDCNAAPTFVGSTTCQTCHSTTYDTVMASGHPYKLTPVVGGIRPTPPPYGDYPANPPAGYTWGDVTYMIGGWGWKVRFIDTSGYVVTSGAAANPVQWNIADASWTTYHTQDEPGTKPYNCGTCHTTGYDPNGVAALPGIVGTWSEPGVLCEECHGPGSRHVADPYVEPMVVDRSAEQCGQCHIRGSVTGIPASGGFIRHHEQWNELFASTKRIMDCVDCHDPHQSARYADPILNPNKSIKSPCETCHFREAAQQSSAAMQSMLECIDCHMPYVTKSALGDAATYTGDVRTHIFGINTDVTAQQFNPAGDQANPYITLTWACRNCHGVTASPKTDPELEAEATGYHD